MFFPRFTGGINDFLSKDTDTNTHCRGPFVSPALVYSCDPVGALKVRWLSPRNSSEWWRACQLGVQSSKTPDGHHRQSHAVFLNSNKSKSKKEGRKYKCGKITDQSLLYRIYGALLSIDIRFPLKRYYWCTHTHEVSLIIDNILKNSQTYSG